MVCYGYELFAIKILIYNNKCCNLCHGFWVLGWLIHPIYIRCSHHLQGLAKADWWQDIVKTSLEAVFKTEWTNYQCEQWTRCWVMLCFFQHFVYLFDVYVDNIYHVILNNTLIIFLYISITISPLHRYIILNIWDIGIWKKSTFCLFIDVDNIYHTLKYTPIIFLYISITVSLPHWYIIVHIWDIAGNMNNNSMFCVFVVVVHHVILIYPPIIFLYISITMSLTTS